MNQDRRSQLEAVLGEDQRQHDPPASAISVLCQRCVIELGISGTGATVLAHREDDGPRATRRGLVYATNDVSTALEELQLTVGEGPCLDAFTSGGPVLINDLSEALTRWPAFAAGARDRGAAAVFSVPLQIGTIRLGSLDCYRDTPGRLPTRALQDLLLLADLATQAILNELDGHASSDLDWLADAYTEVHQATGMLQVQLSTTAEHALLRLRAHAYTHDQTLTEVARQVLTRNLRFTPDN